MGHGSGWNLDRERLIFCTFPGGPSQWRPAGAHRVAGDCQAREWRFSVELDTGHAGHASNGGIAGGPQPAFMVVVVVFSIGKSLSAGRARTGLPATARRANGVFRSSWTPGTRGMRQNAASRGVPNPPYWPPYKLAVIAISRRFFFAGKRKRQL